MSRIFKNEDFEFGLSIALGSTYSDQADVGECLAVAGRIKNGDADSWVREWTAVGGRAREIATQAESAGHRVSARQAWLRAATYFSSATYQAAGAKEGDSFEQLWGEHRDCWDRAAALFEPPVEHVAIPYEDTTIEGYFFKVDDSGARRPLAILNNGSDGPVSAMWQQGGAAGIARAYNCLTFDGPGQNAALVRQHLYFRPDWEAVIAPVVDYALSRPEVDPERIALIGVSQAGYWVPRAVAFEHRIAAAVADPGVMDVGTTWREKLPKSMLRLLEKGEKERFDRDIAMSERFIRGMRAQLEFRMRPFGMSSAYERLQGARGVQAGRARGADPLPDADLRPGQRAVLARAGPRAV